MKTRIYNDVTYYRTALPHGSVIVHFYFKEFIKESELESNQILGEEYEEDKDYSPKVEFLNKELENWLRDNIKSKHMILGEASSFYIYFANKEDAVAFKLRWS